MCGNYVNLRTLVIVFSIYYERNIISTKYETRISASSLNSNFLLSDVLINLKIGVHGSDDLDPFNSILCNNVRGRYSRLVSMT